MKNTILALLIGLILPQLTTAGLGADKPANPIPAKSAPAAPAAPAAKGVKPPFVGQIQAIDKTAKTFTLNGKNGGRVFSVNADTRITKDGQPATLEAGDVGIEAAGVYQVVEGKNVAVSLRLGPKPPPAVKNAPAKKGGK